MSQVQAQKVGLRQRFSAALKAFQMQFTGYGSGSNTWLNELLFGYANNSNINFGQKAGDLEKASIVMLFVNWLGRVLPEAPLQVMEADAEGKEKPVENHPAIALLKRPNPFYSGATLWKSFSLSWLISGNPYFIKVRNGFGQVIQLWYVPSSMMKPIYPVGVSDVFISYYEYEVDGLIFNIDVKDVLHFRDGLDPKTEGRTGLSSFASVLSEVCADKEVPVYHYLLLKSGGAPPIVLSLKDGQSSFDFSSKQVKKDFLAATSFDDRGSVFVSGNAVEISKLGFTPSEMDLSSLRHLPESRIASVIGISKETVGLGAADKNSTYNNVEQADKRSIKTYVKPLWGYIEDELTHQLGPDFGLKPNQRFAFDLSEVAALQEDRNALYERECMAYEKGVKMRSEARSALQLDSKPEDDVYYVFAASEQPKPEPINPLAIGDGKQPPKQLINGKVHNEA